MKITVRPGGIAQTSSACIILGIYEGERSLEEPARAVDRASAGMLQEIMQSGDFKGERHRSFLLYKEGLRHRARALFATSACTSCSYPPRLPGYPGCPKPAS
jgi:hypothetical protein